MRWRKETFLQEVNWETCYSEELMKKCQILKNEIIVRDKKWDYIQMGLHNTRNMKIKTHTRWRKNTQKFYMSKKTFWFSFTLEKDKKDALALNSLNRS